LTTYSETTQMFQAPATIWQAIAEAGPLRTTWAMDLFPMPQDLLDEELEAEEQRLTEQLGSPLAAHAYLIVAPMLWEALAIRNWQEQAGQSPAVFPLETVEDALLVANGDYPLSQAEQQALRALLLVEPALAQAA
jgi:hypothetical protein